MPFLFICLTRANMIQCRFVGGGGVLEMIIAHSPSAVSYGTRQGLTLIPPFNWVGEMLPERTPSPFWVYRQTLIQNAVASPLSPCEPYCLEKWSSGTELNDRIRKPVWIYPKVSNRTQYGRRSSLKQQSHVYKGQKSPSSFIFWSFRWQINPG